LPPGDGQGGSAGHLAEEVAQHPVDGVGSKAENFGNNIQDPELK
jgi:hypothetical protein